MYTSRKSLNLQLTSDFFCQLAIQRLTFMHACYLQRLRDKTEATYTKNQGRQNLHKHTHLEA